MVKRVNKNLPGFLCISRNLKEQEECASNFVFFFFFLVKKKSLTSGKRQLKFQRINILLRFKKYKTSPRERDRGIQGPEVLSKLMPVLVVGNITLDSNYLMACQNGLNWVSKQFLRHESMFESIKFNVFFIQ